MPSVAIANAPTERAKPSFVARLCGHEAHADVNAARNIRNAALVQTRAQVACKPALELDNLLAVEPEIPAL